MHSRAVLVGSAVLPLAMTLAVPAQVAQAAKDVSGQLTGAGSGMTVLALADNGTSVSATVAGNGRFTLKPGKFANQMFPGRGSGPTLHLLRNGEYVGPVVLGKFTKKPQKGKKPQAGKKPQKGKKPVQGYTRLAAKQAKAVKLGKIAFKKKGYAVVTGKLATKLLDTKRTVPLINGVPAGAGNQGAAGPIASSRAIVLGRAAGEAMPANAKTLGADADKDGVPNLADVDMNGDQILDAAQAESALPVATGGTLTGDEVLAGRPQTVVQFAKILNFDANRAINTNRNPTLSWATLQQYLSSNLQIEALAARGDLSSLLCEGNPAGCAAGEALASLLMDCRQLSYCQAGSAAVIVAEPGTGLDRQPLSVLLNSQGLIDVPIDTHSAPGGGTTPFERGFQLSFFPRVSESTELGLVGDSFEFIFLDGQGNELARKAKVLTSSVVTPLEWKSVGGDTQVTEQPQPLTPEQVSALRMEFYRPQRLADASGAQPLMADRGGLQYNVYMMSEGQGSQFYWCRSSQVTPVSGDLVKVVSPTGMSGRDEPLYDRNVDPVNGESLAYTLDVGACLADPAMGPGAPPQAGSIVTIEIESQDGDGNRTRTQAKILAP